MTKFNRKLYDENNQHNQLGSVDLSDTISMSNIETSTTQPNTDEITDEQTTELTADGKINESTMDGSSPLDLSETQPLPVIIQPPKVVHVIPNWAKGLMIFASFTILMTGVAYMGRAFSDVPSSAVSVTKTAKEDQDSTKEFTAELKKAADATGTPYAITTEVIGGGYVVGITTYNPEKVTDMYMDYALAKPEVAQTPLTDDKAKSIEADLSKDLPTINKTIVVKDKSKVTMETYQHDDKYHTVLLYDGKPFAYVATDKDGVHTNYVTSYYVTDVAAQ